MTDTDAQTVASRAVHIVTDSRTLRQLALGREQSRGPDRLGKRLADANQQLISLLRSFDFVYISHVPAHKKSLLENDVADLLAALASEHGFAIHEHLSSDNRATVMAQVNSFRVPRNSVRASFIPSLHSNPTTCEACRCPSHSKQSCFLRKVECFPALSSYCKRQPSRPPPLC